MTIKGAMIAASVAGLFTMGAAAVAVGQDRRRGDVPRRERL